MKVINVESTIFIDVDDTLVMWDTMGLPLAELVTVTDPYHTNEVFLAPHYGHIKVLKDRKVRGSYIVVWSAGGYQWAESVVKALKLEAYVDLIMTKPHMYIDDKKAEEFMCERVYIPYGTGYGK